MLGLGLRKQPTHSIGYKYQSFHDTHVVGKPRTTACYRKAEVDFYTSRYRLEEAGRTRSVPSSITAFMIAHMEKCDRAWDAVNSDVFASNPFLPFPTSNMSKSFQNPPAVPSDPL